MKTIRPPHGFSLIEVLVGVALLGGLAVGAAKTAGFVSKYIRYDRMMADRLAARNIIVEQLDCITTLTPMPNCAGNPPVTMRDAGGNALTPSGILANWRISAKCVPNQGIQVTGVWQRATEHPLTGAPIANTTLMPAVSFCRDMLIGKVPMFTQTAAMAHGSSYCSTGQTSWVGTVSCPAGYMAVSGGSECGASGASQGGGPIPPAYSQWRELCCADASTPAPVVHATCSLPD